MQYNPNEMIPKPKAGFFRFVITKVNFKSQGAYVTEEIDKNGRPYLKPTFAIAIPGKDGLNWSARPFLSTHPRMIFKLKHLCEIANIDFDSGNLNPEDLIGAEGWGKWVPDESGYNDLDLVDFLPERKIAEMPEAERTVFDIAVKAYNPEFQETAGKKFPENAELDDSIPF